MENLFSKQTSPISKHVDGHRGVTLGSEGGVALKSFVSYSSPSPLIVTRYGVLDTERGTHDFEGGTFSSHD